jgi:hypothetical protein
VDPSGNSASLAAAQDAALLSGRLRVVAGDEFVGMAQPLTGGAWAASTEVLAIARRGAPFTSEEQARFGHLAQQTAVALENVAREPPAGGRGRPPAAPRPGRRAG